MLAVVVLESFRSEASIASSPVKSPMTVESKYSPAAFDILIIIPSNSLAAG